jgi:hypothetical protein
VEIPPRVFDGLLDLLRRHSEGDRQCVEEPFLPVELLSLTSKVYG